MPSVLWRCWLGGWKGIWPVKNWWWDAGMVMCLGQCADLHMAQLMPLPLTISCFSKSRFVLSFWCWLTQAVPDKIQEGRKMVVCVCVCMRACVHACVSVCVKDNFQNWVERETRNRWHNHSTTAKQLWRYWHVLRKEDNDWVKKGMEYEVEGARLRGRQKWTWGGLHKKTVRHVH